MQNRWLQQMARISINYLTRYSRGNLRALPAVVLLPLLVGGGGAFWYLGQGNNTKDAYLTAKVERGDIEDTVTALGTVQPLEYVDVGTQVSGQLKTLHVKIGSQVEKGDLIAEIDPLLFESRLGMTEASLKTVRAQLAEKKAARLLAQQTFNRNKGLYTNQAVSEELLEQSQAALDQVTAQIEALLAQADLYQAELMGDSANLRYTKVYAPMSGTVVSLTAREGQTLVANQQAPIILRIADLNTMTVWAQVSEADVPRIDLNKVVFFSPIGLPNKLWRSEVKQVLPTPESVNSVILYDVLFDVPNKKQLLKPQMTVQTSFVIAKAEHTLLVPVSALQSAAKHHKGGGAHDAKMAAQKEPKDKKNNGQMGNDDPVDLVQPSKLYTVRVLTESGEVVGREVVVGVKSRVKAEIISGLAEGEEVIVGTPEEGGKKNKQKLTSGATQS